MERYDYLIDMADKIKEVLPDYYTAEEVRENRDEVEQKLNDELWNCDAVTGNESGSYFCNGWKAMECVTTGGMKYLGEAIRDFCIDAETLGKEFAAEHWEWMDVIIRCYVLPQAIAQALDEIEEEAEA